MEEIPTSRAKDAREMGTQVGAAKGGTTMTTARIGKAIAFCAGMGAVIGVAVVCFHIPSGAASVLVGVLVGVAVLSGMFSSERCSTSKN